VNASIVRGVERNGNRALQASRIAGAFEDQELGKLLAKAEAHLTRIAISKVIECLE